MIKLIISFVLLSQVLLFGSNQLFNNDVEQYLEKDFYKFGINHNKSSDKIIFSETNMLFENGRSDIRKHFKIILNDFFPRYLELLVKHKINIKQVIIKGYTSSANRMGNTVREKYRLNKILSQERANKFLDYSKSIDNEIVQRNIKWINSHFITKGMSSSELIYDSKGVEDESASRRIELEIVFYKKLEEVKQTPIVIKKKQNKTVYLADYVKRLLIESPTLNEKYNLLKAFEADVKIANAAFYPTATLNFKETQYQESTNDRFTDTQSKDITIRYNLFNGFKDLNENKIKQYNYKSNQYLKEQIEGDLIFSLVEAFLSIQREQEILNLAQLNLKDYDLWIAKEDIKFQNGMVSLKNYAKIQSRDTTQRMNFRELNKKYKDTISTFNRYLNFNEDDVQFFERLNPSNKYISNKEVAYFDIKQYSPYLKESEQIVEVYKAKLNQSEVNFYPTVDLIAKKSILDENYEVGSSDETKETSIALEARLELYSGGKDSANYEKKLFEYREKIAKKESVIKDVKYKLDLAFNKFELTSQKEILLKNLILKREDSLLGASYDYKFAKIDANGLLDSVDDLYTAKKMYIENNYDKLISKYEIFNNIGLIKNIILGNEIEE